MKKMIFSIAVLAFLFTACDNDNKTAGKNDKDSKDAAKDSNDKKFNNTNMESDTKFAVDAADAGMFEVKAGQLAQTNGASSAVKDLGKMMVDQHTAANNELMAAAQKMNISLPAAIGEEHQKAYNDLAGKKGADFDKAYTDKMVDGHEKVIKMFRDEAENGENPTLKAWAAGKLTTLQQHLDMCNKAKEAVKGNK